MVAVRNFFSLPVRRRNKISHWTWGWCNW